MKTKVFCWFIMDSGKIIKGNDKLMEEQWNGITITKSKETIVAEDNHYFPPKWLSKDFSE